MISIHAPRTGSDNRCRSSCRATSTYFNPRSPHGERPAKGQVYPNWQTYFNPRSPHGERPAKSCLQLVVVSFQSTLPARGATPPACASKLSTMISIHAPRTGSDPCGRLPPPCVCQFQSTLPARGATQNPVCNLWLHHFNPRSPHGERQCRVADGCPCNPFQSTLPARGATIADSAKQRAARKFQSTLPARGATSPAAGSAGARSHFNPRSPHGERQRVRDAPTRAVVISIHAPRTGSDTFAMCSSAAGMIFQSTLPARGATACVMRPRAR